MSEHKYSVCYIDEVEKDRTDFQELEDDELEITVIHPYDSKSVMIKYIIENKYDGMVIDFDLGEFEPKVKYDGVDLMNEMFEYKKDFPCIILTSHSEEAHDLVSAALIDPNKIYTKEDITEKQEDFKLKIKLQVDYFNGLNSNDQTRFEELIAKREKGELSNEEQQEIVDVDTRLEKRLDKKRAFPNGVKDTEGFQKLLKVLDDAESAISKFEKGK